jgi:hypothetical protein
MLKHYNDLVIIFLRKVIVMDADPLSCIKRKFINRLARAIAIAYNKLKAPKRRFQ